MLDIKNILNFANFLYKFQQVKRVQFAVGEDRSENDAEHSFQLAMLAWYISSCNKLDLDLDLIIKYSLIHDLVEIYAGDTFAFEKNEEIKNSKKERERTALEKIKLEFPEFEDLSFLIEKYERKEDRESHFVYALDKVIAEMGNYLDDGRSSKKFGWTLDQVIENQTKKVKCSPEIEFYSNKLIEILKENKDRIYN